MTHSSQDIPVAILVDGLLTESDGDSHFDVVNPSNGRKLFSVPVGSQADVERVVSATRRAFDDGRWSEAPPSFRKKSLHQFAESIARESAKLDALDAEEMGKPISVRRGDAQSSAGLMHFYAEAVDKVIGDVYPSDKSSLVVQPRVPQGVVAAVVPWNFPTANAVLKVAPALAAGNTVILKPSEMSSRSAVLLGQLALEAGVPAGVLNVLPGRGETVGKALALHHGVDMVAFTGSTAVGKQILQYSGQSNMKVVMAECGGKSPHIVCEDVVDIEGTSKAIAELLLLNQGQLCSVGSRLLVPRALQAVMLEKLSEHIRHIVVGDALNPRTTFGPIASERQCGRVMQFIESAASDGARLASGGRRVLTESGGFFVQPTIFADVPVRSRIAQEEIFGPVLSVIPFDDEDDAIRIANETQYGLVAYVWTNDLSAGMRLAKGIRSSVLVNAHPPQGEGPGHAFSAEPAGQSGIGTESGLPGMESYMRRHLIWFNHR